MGKNLKNNMHTYVCLCVCMYSGIWKIHAYKCTYVCVYVSGIWKIHAYKCTYMYLFESLCYTPETNTTF